MVNCSVGIYLCVTSAHQTNPLKTCGQEGRKPKVYLISILYLLFIMTQYVLWMDSFVNKSTRSVGTYVWLLIMCFDITSSITSIYQGNAVCWLSWLSLHQFVCRYLYDNKNTNWSSFWVSITRWIVEYLLLKSLYRN